MRRVDAALDAMRARGCGGDARAALGCVKTLLVLVGMWCERFLLIVNSLFRDFLPSSAGMFYPTVWDLVFLFGSMAFFLVLLLLFARLLPMLSMAELRKLLPRHAGEDA